MLSSKNMTGGSKSRKQTGANIVAIERGSRLGTDTNFFIMINRDPSATNAVIWKAKPTASMTTSLGNNNQMIQIANQ